MHRKHDQNCHVYYASQVRTHDAETKPKNKNRCLRWNEQRVPRSNEQFVESGFGKQWERLKVWILDIHLHSNAARPARHTTLAWHHGGGIA